MVDNRRDACSIRMRQRWIYLSVFLLSGLAVRPASADGLDIVWKRSSSTPTTRGAVVAFSPDGQIIASGTRVSGNKAIELWRSSDGALLRTLILPLPLQVPDGENISAIAFSPDGRLLATSHVYGTVRLWRASDGHLVYALTGAGNNIAFSPDGQLLATASKDGKVRLWRMADGTLLRLVIQGRMLDMPAIAFSPDGKILATSAGEAGLPLRKPPFPRDTKLWRVSDGKLLRTIKGHTSWASFVPLIFSPDGQTLAAGQGSQIWLWRIGDGTLLRKLRFHHWAVNLASFSPDGKILVSGAADPHVTGVGRGEIAIWRARDGELLHTYDPGGRVWAAALSPDSRLITYGLAEPATVVVARNPGEALSEQAQTQQR